MQFVSLGDDAMQNGRVVVFDIKGDERNLSRKVSVRASDIGSIRETTFAEGCVTHVTLKKKSCLTSFHVEQTFEEAVKRWAGLP